MRQSSDSGGSKSGYVGKKRVAGSNVHTRAGMPKYQGNWGTGGGGTSGGGKKSTTSNVTGSNVHTRANPPKYNGNWGTGGGTSSGKSSSTAKGSGKWEDDEVKFAKRRRTAYHKAMAKKYSKSSLESAAKRRTDKTYTNNAYNKSSAKPSGKNAATVRHDMEYRAKNKQFVGKYYGPEAFKGNLDMVQAWQRAGKPDIRTFKRKYRG